MSSRVLKGADIHQRLGWTAKSEHKNAKWDTLKSLSVYPAVGLLGRGFREVGITAKGVVQTSVLYLMPVAQIELVKGLLINLLEQGNAISLTADEEFRQILKQVEGAIAAEEEEASQIAQAVREHVYGPQEGEKKE